MMFVIFRFLSNGNAQKIGETKFLSDARSILENWHVGWINNPQGQTVFEKNLSPTHKKEN